MQELKNLFCEMFFFVHVVLSVKELSLRTDWLMSQGSLRPLVPLLWMQLLSWFLLRPDQYSKKSFIMFCLDFVLFGSPPFHFSNSSSNFRTVSLFCFLWLSMTSLTSLQFISIFICTPHQSSHCTIFSFFFFTLLSWLFVGKKMPSTLIVSSSCQKVLLLSSTQSLCERVKGLLQELLQKLMPLTVGVPMIVSNSLRSVPLQKC